MTNITRDAACNRMIEAADAGQLIQNRWRMQKDGREMVCLLAAAQPGIKNFRDCLPEIMPKWMAPLLNTLSDNVRPAQTAVYGKRFAQALRNGRTDDAVLRVFVRICVDSARHSAEIAGKAKDYWVSPVVAAAMPLLETAAATAVAARDIDAIADRAAVAFTTATAMPRSEQYETLFNAIIDAMETAA